MEEEDLFEQDKPRQVVHISVTLVLNEIIEEDAIQDILAEMEYDFKHPGIKSTRINGTIF